LQTPKKTSQRVRVRARRPSPHSGFTYIGLLILVAAMGLALTVVAQVWQTLQLRDKEEELLFVGAEIRSAIGRFIASTGRYPQSLEDLLKDPAYPGVRRSLRKIYRDPMTGRPDWVLVKPDGNTVLGVHSMSDAQPLKQSGFSLANQGFEAKEQYSEWVFLAHAVQRNGAATTPAATQEPGAANNFDPVPQPLDDGGAGLGRTGPRVRR